jgi:hypothetical protein
MKRIVSILAILSLAVMASSVHAQPSVDFTVPASNPGASISYAGGSNPLVGTNISITEVTGLGGTPLHNGVTQAVVGGVLNFTTGNFSNSVGGDWEFGVGSANSLTIAGAVPGAGIPASTTLLQGTVLSAKVDVTSGKVALGAFINTIDPTLAAYFGLLTPGSGGFNIRFLASAVAPNAFTSTTVSSGDVLSTAVPAPGFLVLLCSGSVASVFGYAWRRVKSVTV